MNQIRAFIYYTSIVLGFIVMVPFWYPVTALVSGFNRGTIIVGYWHRLMFKLLGIKVEVQYPENFDPKDGCVVMANHQSFLDIGLIVGWVRPVAFLAKKELFRPPVFGWAMRKARIIPVDRGNRRGNKDLPNKMAKNIDEGFSYCVYPEGTRSRSGKMNPFKRGIFHYISQKPVPILPVTIDGAGDIIPRKKFQMKRGTIRVIIHPPINAEEVATMDSKELSEKVYNIVESGLPQNLRNS